MNKLRLATKKLMKVARYFFGYDHSIYFKNESNLSMDSPTDKTKILMVKPYEYIVEQICFLRPTVWIYTNLALADIFRVSGCCKLIGIL